MCLLSTIKVLICLLDTCDAVLNHRHVLMSMKIAGLQNTPALSNKKLIGSVPAAPLLKRPCKVDSQHIQTDVDDSDCPDDTP